MQWPLFPPPTKWEKPDLAALPTWKRARRVGFDIETYDPTIKTLGPAVRRGGFIAGYSFCLDGKVSHYVPLRHLGGNNVDHDRGMAYLRDQLGSFKGELVGANLNYDLDYIMEAGCHIAASRFSDIQVAAALISSLHHRFNMSAIAERLGIEGKDESMLRYAAVKFSVDPKADMWKLPSEYVGPYAEQDAALPLQILDAQHRQLAELQLEQVWDLESKLLPILVKMRRHGVRVDFDRFEQLRQWSVAEEAKALEVVRRETGVRIEVGETRQVELLDRAMLALGVVVPRTRTLKPSVKDDFLATLQLPAADALVHARQVAQLRSTFITGTLEHVIGDRIHCTFKQLANDDGGARFGRMSCVKPNLQNQPSKDTEIGHMLRSAFIPDEGKLWCSADYSAQEPRMLVHWAVQMLMDGVQPVARQFREDPKTDSHRMMASLIFKCPQSMVTDKQRKQAKVIFLGLCYGMGSGKLANSLGMPTHRVDGGFEIAGREAMILLNRFHESVPYVRQLDKALQTQAKRNGFVRTLSGRLCKFPLDDEGKYDWVRVALNRVIQGSSADQTKKAMVECDEAGLPIQLQVHDELCASVESREQGLEMARIMENAMPLCIPTVVDVEFGASWAEASEEVEAKPVAVAGDFWGGADKPVATRPPKQPVKEVWF